MAMKQTGKCLCGAVTFEAEVPKTGHHVCHCTMCRKWGGPGLAVSVDSVSFSGEDHVGVYTSSDWAERGFCKTCGTHLFYRLRDDGYYVLWVGAFDDPGAFSVTGEIFVDQKPDGYAFAGDHPRLTRQEFMASIGMG